MGFRERFDTSTMVRTLLSGRLAIGVGVGVAMAVAGLPLVVSIGTGAALYAALVGAALRRPRRTAARRLDPFTVGEPWRQYVQGAQRAARQVHDTVASTPSGPLRDRLESIVERLDHGLDEVERVARRGDEIDAAVRRLDPTALRSKLATLEQQRSSDAREPVETAETTEGLDDVSDELGAAIDSVRDQLETTERLKARSDDTARRLRLSQTRLDELTARAAEVSIGAGDTDIYEHDVDDLVIELEGLRLAIEETNRP